jgi:hypothetical protein
VKTSETPSGTTDATQQSHQCAAQATGGVLDPKLLFFGRNSSKTRVSVINLSGLASEDFVNRLQMTLFGWVKKHPSSRGTLQVIDEARRLGMIAVTQAPIHWRADRLQYLLKGNTAPRVLLLKAACPQHSQ